MSTSRDAKTFSYAEVEFLKDAIEDALRELDEEPLSEFVSQGVIDKLTSSLEIINGKN